MKKIYEAKFGFRLDFSNAVMLFTMGLTGKKWCGIVGRITSEQPTGAAVNLPPGDNPAAIGAAAMDFSHGRKSIAGGAV